MQWGRTQHTAWLYRDIRHYAPQIFDFDSVVIHEEDAPGDFDCQPCLARRTALGTFYRLTAYIHAAERWKRMDLSFAGDRSL